MKTIINPDMNKRLFTLREAALYLAMTEKGLYRAVERQQVPFRRRGRKYVFDKIELDKFISSLPGVTFEEIMANQ